MPPEESSGDRKRELLGFKPPNNDVTKMDEEESAHFEESSVSEFGDNPREPDDEDEFRQYEQDYLECRAMTQKIKETVISEIGGSEEENRRAIEFCISRGRCSFTKSYNAPSVIGEDNPTLKEYQVAAVHWLLALYQNGYNGLLADDMGLGKSAESICFLKRLYVDGMLNKPTIITCPTTLLDNWMNELRRWAPGLKVMRYHGTQPERRQLMRQFELGSDVEDEEEDMGDSIEDEEEEATPVEEDTKLSVPEEAAGEIIPLSTGISLDNSMEPLARAGDDSENPGEIQYYPLPEGVAYHILVTSHPTLANTHDRQHFFKLQEFGFLVVDEAHGLKNAASNRYQQINKSVRAPLRLLLTGSPIQNQIGELKNLLGFLNPYRGVETFNLEHALIYHRRLWEQALEREKEREALKTTLPGLITDAMKLDMENGDLPSMTELNSSPPSASSNSSRVSTSKSDPEILFYQQLLAPLILRRLKAEVIHNFPSKTSKIELLDMHPAQQELYHKELRNSRGILAASSRGGLNKKTSQTAIKGLVFRLRRICNHPLLLQGYFSPEDRENFARYLQTKVKDYRKFSLERVMQHIQDWSDFDLHNEALHHLPALQNFRIPKDEFGKGCKTNRLLELIQEKCVQQNEKMLIFSQFTTYLDIIQEILRLYCPDVEHLRLDGSTAVNERSAMVSSFQNNTSNAKLFLLSTKAGGVGLNLTSSNTVVLMDQDWNPHNDRQAEDRVHRLGQTGDVTVYRLCCRHSFEESVLSCCKKKLELDEAFGGVQEALPLEIFEEILRDAQNVVAAHAEPVSEVHEPVPEKKRSPKKVVKAGSGHSTPEEPESKPKKVGPTKRTAERLKNESPLPKKNNTKASTKKASRKQAAAAPPAAKNEDTLLPGGDSD